MIIPEHPARSRSPLRTPARVSRHELYRAAPPMSPAIVLAVAGSMVLLRAGQTLRAAKHGETSLLPPPYLALLWLGARAAAVLRLRAQSERGDVTKEQRTRT